VSEWRTRVRAIVLHAVRPEALVLSASGGPALPEFELPGRAWPGKPGPFVDAVRGAVGIDVALLRTAERRDDEERQLRHLTVVFAAREETAELPAGARWVGGAAEGDLGPVLGELGTGQQPAGQQPAGQPPAGQPPAGRQPWRERAWLRAAMDWIVTSLAALGRSVRGPVEQIRVAELSCVLRAATDDGDVYFKATTQLPLFVDEGAVMVVLAELFPAEVPAPLAVDRRRGWMLLPDVGPEIGWSAPVEVREDVVRAFARLQIRSAGSVDRLLQAGCLDRRPQWLARQATQWPATVDLSRWLSAAEVAELTACVAGLAAASAALADQPVPATLGHGDMHLGNVARAGSGYWFFDWTDGCVMHPFLDMIAIFFFEDDPAVRDRLRDAYLAEWAAYAPAARLLDIWRLAEPLAAFNHAISYVSISAHVEQGTDDDGMAEQTGGWLRRLVDLLRQPAPATG
jgi:hypothetical protein